MRSNGVLERAASLRQARELTGQASTEQLIKAGVKLGADAYAVLSREWLGLIGDATNGQQLEALIAAEPLPLKFLGMLGNGLDAAMMLSANAGHKEVIGRRRRLRSSTPLSPPVNGGILERAIGVDYGNYIGTNAELDAFRMRAFTIAHVESERVLAEIKASLEEVLKGGGGYSEFRKAARPLLEQKILTDAQLNTVYSTNLHTAYNAGKYYEQQQAIDVLPYIEYVTAGDNRVREAHQLLQGFIARKDDPIWDSIYPPNGFGCRCSTVEHDDFSLKQENKRLSQGLPLNVSDIASPGFDVNPGKILDGIVLLVKESGLTQKTAVDYGLSKLATSAASKSGIPFKSGIAAVTDYAGIDRVITEDSIGGISGEQVRSVLENPAEVWGWPNHHTVYLKQFAEGVVGVEITGDVKRAFKVNDADELRKGILMYRGR